ncbi:MAG TPA: hypothetical protein VNO32_52055 [Candidatus Acidoferrum sp.]|nr:hypothetical protein [Candidatus Acidoferrum sp.]
MKVRRYGPMPVLLMGCMLLMLPGIARAEHTKLFCLSSSGTFKSAVSGVCPTGSTKLPLAVADSVSAVQASAEISADGNVRQQDKVNGNGWIDVVTLDGPGSYAIFFRSGVFNNNGHVNCVATSVNQNNVAPISSFQINLKGPGGMVINSVGANGLISTDFDLVCSGN